MNFQSESKRSGDEFENLVLNDLKERGFGVIKKNVYVEQSGCEVDFVAYGAEWVIEYVEAKGGKEDAGKRPGAQRTDNVKKAIANGALVKAIDPSIYFVVYFSAKPTTGSSSDKMLKTALCHKIIDEVRYITNKELIDTQLHLFNAESEAEK
jgi:Holliday junction resolvase-like predicted endonuclease